LKYYINFLRDKPIIRSLSLVNFIASFGAWFSTVAIYTMVVEFGSSEFAIAIVTAMHFIPAILIAPFSGSLIDRLRIKPLMVTLLFIELSMTACFLLIETSSQLWLLLIFIFIRMSAASMFFSSEMSLLAKIATGKDLQTAISKKSNKSLKDISKIGGGLKDITDLSRNYQFVELLSVGGINAQKFDNNDVDKGDIYSKWIVNTRKRVKDLLFRLADEYPEYQITFNYDAKSFTPFSGTTIKGKSNIRNQYKFVESFESFSNKGDVFKNGNGF
jgi:hypothetical protein